MYDITHKDTFDNLDSWFQSINESLGESNNYLVVLLGNKVDLVNNEPDKRQVAAEDDENICKEKGIYWGVKAALEILMKNKLKKYLRYLLKKYIKKLELIL